MMGRAIALFICAVGVAQAEPTREEFGYEAPIALKGTASVYRAPLTTSVYQGVTRADLGDMRVFNASGEIVPHGLTRPAAESTKQSVALPLFPLELSPDRPHGDVSLQVEVKNDGAIVNVNNSTRAISGQRTYLLDATQVEKTLTALTFQWQSEGGNSNLRRINIETSDDLKNWRVLTQGILAKLEHDGQIFERNRVEFPAHRVKYLRILPVDSSGDAGLTLTRVDGELSAEAEPSRNWLTLTAQTSEKPGERRYVLGAKMTIDRARIALAANSVARVTILFRYKDGDSWQYAGQKTVYRLETSGTVIKDDEINFGRGIVADQWLLRQVGGSGGGLSQVSALDLGWIPHDLVFVARGPEPFTLAYGRNGLTPVDDGINELLQQTMRGNHQRVEIGEAKLESSRELRGARALQRSWTAGWKSWLLWAILLLGVGMLTYLALRIGKQIGQEPE
jgi:hypothetical protein